MSRIRRQKAMEKHDEESRPKGIFISRRKIAWTIAANAALLIPMASILWAPVREDLALRRECNVDIAQIVRGIRRDYSNVTAYVPREGTVPPAAQTLGVDTASKSAILRIRAAEAFTIKLSERQEELIVNRSAFNLLHRSQVMKNADASFNAQASSIMKRGDAMVNSAGTTARMLKDMMWKGMRLSPDQLH